MGLVIKWVKKPRRKHRDPVFEAGLRQAAEELKVDGTLDNDPPTVAQEEFYATPKISDASRRLEAQSR